MGNRQTVGSRQVEDVESRPTTEGSSVVLFNERDRIKGLTRLITAESTKKKQVRKDQYDFNKVNNLLALRGFPIYCSDRYFWGGRRIGVCNRQEILAMYRVDTPFPLEGYQSWGVNHGSIGGSKGDRFKHFLPLVKTSGSLEGTNTVLTYYLANFFRTKKTPTNYILLWGWPPPTYPCNPEKCCIHRCQIHYLIYRRTCNCWSTCLSEWTLRWWWRRQNVLTERYNCRSSWTRRERRCSWRSSRHVTSRPKI